ncbi:MAG: lysophospholipid acyltransferase family protein [Acidimicrobiia bacterium]
MTWLLENKLLRRLVTVPVVYISLVVVTMLLPLLLAIAALVDLMRFAGTRRPAMALRMLGFGWVYLLGESWALITMALAGLLGRTRAVETTYALQRAWISWNFWALRIFFSLRFEVSGSDSIPPGPILLLSRHASLIDTMLPATYVVRPHRINLKYVLKRELLADPAIDIGGNRLPNHFVDRGADDAQAELSAIKRLGTNLSTNEGVLIYPEGTRFSEAKRVKYVARLSDQNGAIGELAQRLRRVLPPRPGGTLALLDASSADVVLLMHKGLEGFASVKDIWSGGLVGTTITVCFERIRRSEIPRERSARIEWLFETWKSIDTWVVAHETPRMTNNPD